MSVVVSGLAAVDLQGQETFTSRCGAGVHAEERTGWMWLPRGEIFCPLVANPKEVRTFASYLRGDFATIADPGDVSKTNIVAVGLGDRFSIARSAGLRSGDGLQLSLAGAVFTQLNLDKPSFDLVNADYVVGLPLTYRRGSVSTRLRVYHQSSHLGDELLLSRDLEETNLSYESAELIVSHEAGALRTYLGGEVLFRRAFPKDLPQGLVRGGVEMRPAGIASGRLLAALDIKALDRGAWEFAWSARAVFDIASILSPADSPRTVGLLAEYYDGAAPYGLFFREKIRYLGLGLNLSQ